MMLPAAQISQAPVVQCGADVPSAKSASSPPAPCKNGRPSTGSKAQHHQAQDERPSPIVVIPSPIGGLAEPASHGPQPNNVSPSIEPPVQNYVDGVPYLWTPGPLFSLPDVAQVSMMQAAGGSDYMRGAPDGTLQVVTRTPPRAFTADVSATYGNYGTVGASGYVAGGLASNLTASLAGQYHQQFDGFGTNLYNGKDVQDGWNVATRGKLHWTPGPDTTIDLEADYYRFRAGNPAIRNTGLSLLGTTAPGGAYDVDSEIQPDIQSRYGGASLVIKQALDSMDLTSTSAYREGRLAVAIDADTTEQDILSIEQHQMLRQASQDLKLSSQAGAPVSWALGLSYLHSTSGYDPVIASGAFFAGPNTLYATSKLDSYAAYGHVSAPLSPTTTARIGLRYTIDSRAISQSQTETVGDVVSYVDTPQSEAHTFHGLTGDIGVEQRLSSVLTGYVTYDHAQQSGTLLPNTFPALTIKPETLDAFRAGFKAVAGRGAFVANLSAFLNDYTNMQAMQRVEG
ncbi:TonB-dependent receptor [Novosphingobium sp. 9]|uniref:TonB-dependent receptor n=1 Tax=Novosphingobium sp. 9 TaxID=2025349 RepID=UPI0021B6AD9B|nr:hypothetical protein [Novosphingobium sp. 9]